MSDFDADGIFGAFTTPAQEAERLRKINAVAAKRRQADEQNRRDKTPLGQIRGKTIDGVKYVRAEDVAANLQASHSWARVHAQLRKYIDR